jgi:SAM-dependent methyltransferase
LTGASERFEPRAYWDSRLRREWGPTGVGFLGLGDAYNRALYRVKADVFRRAVRSLPVRLSDATVLDIGSGTGFVVRQWHLAGAGEVVGVDFAPVAVAHLREEFRQDEFHELDIGQPGAADVLGAGRFDCISALDVLYHIVDDGAYRQAIQNVAALLRPNGYFLIADNFLHGPTIRVAHQVSHSLADMEAWFRDAGLEIERRRPQYVLMNYPVDSRSRLLHGWWRQLSRLLRRWPEKAGAIGALLAPFEIGLTRVIREGPTTELAECRKMA